MYVAKQHLPHKDSPVFIDIRTGPLVVPENHSSADMAGVGEAVSGYKSGWNWSLCRSQNIRYVRTKSEKVTLYGMKINNGTNEYVIMYKQHKYLRLRKIFQLLTFTLLKTRCSSPSWELSWR